MSGGGLNNYSLVNTGLSGSLLGSTSKYDSGRLEQYMKNLRNFFKIYAFRPEVYLEVFQVQIRTTLYALQVNCQNIDESSHQEVINLLVRNTCWANQNKGFLKVTSNGNFICRTSFY